MENAKSLVVMLVLVGSLLVAKLSIASEDTSPPSDTSYEVKVLAQVATALAVGIKAMRDLDGPPIGNSNLDRLNIPTPGMDCGYRSIACVCCMPQRFTQQK